MEKKKIFKCLREQCGVSYAAESLGPCPICGNKYNKMDKNKNLFYLLLFSGIIVLSIAAWRTVNEPQATDNKDNERVGVEVIDPDIKAIDEIEIPEEPIESEIITSETTTERISETEEANNSREVVAVIKLGSDSDKIKEFETYYSLNGVEKVNHFIKKVIHTKNTEDLSTGQTEEFNSILEGAFTEFYDISGQLNKEIICEYLSSFKSEFKNNGIAMNQKKYKQLKERGDDC